MRRGNEAFSEAPEAGSMTVEALLALSVTWFFALLMIAFVQTAGQLLDLDRALTASVQEMTAASYTLQQGIGRIVDHDAGEGILPAAATALWADRCLQAHLEAYDRLKPALIWKTAICPSNFAPWGTEDVQLTLVFCPSRVKSAAAALLPGHLTYTLTKQQRAWLVGRELLPFRGLEESAAMQKKGPLVFITRWGTHYHQEDCRYLMRSKIPCRLEALARIYQPCSVCRPDARAS